MKLATSLFFLAASANAFAPSLKNKSVSKLFMSDDGESPAAPDTPAPPAPAKESTPGAFPSVAGPVTTMESTTSESFGGGLTALQTLAPQLNPIVPFWDPLNLVNFNIYNMGQDATIGFLRHAEIKHGRVAMAAFVGYCIQSNWHWPWAMMRDGTPFPSIDLSPEAQWDAVPEAAKWQIFTVIAFLEIWDEGSGGSAWGEEGVDMPHYTKGRQPGKYPSFQVFRDNVHFVPNLYDPFNLFTRMPAEKKEERLITEINNGRLAMIGIFAFMAADKVEGSVPFLNQYAQPYDGNIMAPFSGQFSFFS